MKLQVCSEPTKQSIVRRDNTTNLESTMSKAIVTALWLLIIYNYLQPLAGSSGQLLSWLGPILLLAHLVEYFLFKEKIKAKGDTANKAFLMTMIFGVAYFGS